MLRGFKKVRCPHCGHIFMVADIEDNATVAELPVHCPKCGNVVETSGIVGILTRLLGLARKPITMLFIAIAMVSLSSCNHYQDWPCNEVRMKTARAEVQAQDCVVLLQELVDASKGNIAAVTRMTCLTPEIISRLLNGDSKPTKITDIGIKAVAEDYYFFKKRFWVLDLCKDWKWRKPQYWLMNLPYVADPFLNYPYGIAETIRVKEYGIE